MRQRRRNLGQQARGKDVGEVCNLLHMSGADCSHAAVTAQGTFRFFLPSSTLARASLAPMPSVLPRNRTSSIASLLFRAWMWGAMSSAVVSLRPWPSMEKTLDVDMMRRQAGHHSGSDDGQQSDGRSGVEDGGRCVVGVICSRGTMQGSAAATRECQGSPGHDML